MLELFYIRRYPNKKWKQFTHWMQCVYFHYLFIHLQRYLHIIWITASLNVPKILQGYEGDGETCRPIDECNTAENCDVNAQCLFDSNSQRYKCQCMPGFRGTGTKGGCIPDPDVACNVRNTCHEWATCAYDAVDLIYRCQCNPGYQGDGYTCEKTSVPCNVINTCHVRAECLFDTNSRGFRYVVLGFPLCEFNNLHLFVPVLLLSTANC